LCIHFPNQTGMLGANVPRRCGKGRGEFALWNTLGQGIEIEVGHPALGRVIVQGRTDESLIVIEFLVSRYCPNGDSGAAADQADGEGREATDDQLLHFKSSSGGGG
jgi:hypothetical protein